MASKFAFIVSVDEKNKLKNANPTLCEIERMMIRACKSENHKNVTKLLDDGLDPDFIIDDKIPILVAADGGYFDIVESLLQSGAESTVTDNKGKTFMEKMVFTPLEREQK